MLKHPHDWDPHSFFFSKVSQRKEDDDLFSGIAAIPVNALHSKFYETDIEPVIHDTVYDPSFITKQLLSQVIITDAKVPYATGITNIDEDVFEGRRQDITSHRTLTTKERHLDVNTSDLREI